MHDDVKLFFATQKENAFEGIPFDYHETIDADHGKIEVRRYWTTSHIDWLQGKENWAKLQTICMVERERQFNDKTERETSYYIEGRMG